MTDKVDRVTKAIFPVAGLGTRFLPATKSIPKEILPLVDKPLIQYAIDEARAAGITEFVFVTARGKSALEDYFDGAPELEAQLRKKNKTDLLDLLKQTDMESGRVAYVRQTRALGLGHAVWCARNLVRPTEPVAVILPDDVILAPTPCLAQMVEAYEGLGSQGAMVATMQVAGKAISSYGVIDPDPQAALTRRLVPARGLVEKPAIIDAPSDLAVIGRYILPPTIFKTLSRKTVGTGGEIQLTDAISAEITAGRPVWGFRFEGQRFDCGSQAGYLQATVCLGLSDPDLSGEFEEFLASLHPQRIAAE